MKANLMYRDKEFNIKAEPCHGKDTLAADFELKRIISNMAQGDEIIRAACSSALFSTLKSIEEIRYRQENLQDAFRNPHAVRKLYEITVETEKKKRSSWNWLSSAYLSSTFSSATALLKI
jgi:hypothetical protein